VRRKGERRKWGGEREVLLLSGIERRERGERRERREEGEEGERETKSILTCLFYFFPRRVHHTSALVGEMVDLRGEGVEVHVAYEISCKLDQGICNGNISDEK
jgi:hypothetical protein